MIVPECDPCTIRALGAMTALLASALATLALVCIACGLKIWEYVREIRERRIRMLTEANRNYKGGKWI